MRALGSTCCSPNTPRPSSPSKTLGDQAGNVSLGLPTSADSRGAPALWKSSALNNYVITREIINSSPIRNSKVKNNNNKLNIKKKNSLVTDHVGPDGQYMQSFSLIPNQGGLHSGNLRLNPARDTEEKSQWIRTGYVSHGLTLLLDHPCLRSCLV